MRGSVCVCTCSDPPFGDGYLLEDVWGDDREGVEPLSGLMLTAGKGVWHMGGQACHMYKPLSCHMEGLLCMY